MNKIENNPLELRRKFHEAFNLPFNHNPVNLNYERVALHKDMMQEELDEYKHAAVNKDLVLTADALIDMQEVLFGMFAEHGMLHKWNDLYCEVHRSNMSKLDSQGKPIINGKDGHYTPTKPLGKVIKSTNFVEPDFERILKQ